MAAFAGLAAYPVVVAERFAELFVAAGLAVGFLLVTALAAAWAAGVAWTLALVAADYGVALAVRGDSAVDPAAPLYAAGLLVLAELGYWSVELRGPGRDESRVIARRLAAIGALAFLSVVLGVFVVVVTAVPLGGGLAWDVVGVVAATATLAILARLARRSGDA